MSNLTDYIPDWLKRVLNPNVRKVTEARYKGEKVFVHNRTDIYAIITYQESGEKLFKVDLVDLEE